MRTWRMRATLAVLIASVGSAAGGCGQTIVVRQYPSFYTPDLKTLAVVPFDAEGAGYPAGEFTERLCRGLRINGTYDVLVVRPRPGESVSDLVTRLRRDRRADVVCLGAVRGGAVRTNAEIQKQAVYATDRKGKRYVKGYNYLTVLTHRAQVSAEVRMLRVADARTLATTSGPLTGQYAVQTTPKGITPVQTLHKAADALVNGLVERLAITFKPVRISTSKAIRTAVERDGQVEATDKIPLAAETLHVLLALPAACTRNRFRVSIVRQGAWEDELTDAGLVWDGQENVVRLDFPLRRIVEAGGGAGEYLVRLHTVGSVVVRKFTVVAPESSER